MLRPRDRRVPRLREPLYARGNRPLDREDTNCAGEMGVYDVYAETAGAEVYTSVYNGASGGDL